MLRVHFLFFLAIRDNHSPETEAKLRKRIREVSKTDLDEPV